MADRKITYGIEVVGTEAQKVIQQLSRVQNELNEANARVAAQATTTSQQIAGAKQKEASAREGNIDRLRRENEAYRANLELLRKQANVPRVNQISRTVSPVAAGQANLAAARAGVSLEDELVREQVALKVSIARIIQSFRNLEQEEIRLERFQADSLRRRIAAEQELQAARAAARRGTPSDVTIARRAARDVATGRLTPEAARQQVITQTELEAIQRGTRLAQQLGTTYEELSRRAAAAGVSVETLAAKIKAQSAAAELERNRAIRAASRVRSAREELVAAQQVIAQGGTASDVAIARRTARDVVAGRIEAGAAQQFIVDQTQLAALDQGTKLADRLGVSYLELEKRAQVAGVSVEEFARKKLGSLTIEERNERQLRKLNPQITETGTTSKRASTGIEQMARVLRSLFAAFVGFQVFRGIQHVLRDLFQFQVTLENLRLGVAEVVSISNRFVERTSRAILPIPQQIAFGFQLADEAVHRLTEDAINLGLPLDTLIKTFQTVSGVALSAGVGLGDTLDILRGINVVAQRLDIPFAQVARTVDNIFTGLNVQRTQLGVILKLNQSIVREQIAQGTLASFLLERLKVVTAILPKNLETFNGIRESIKSIIFLLGAQVGAGAFAVLKSGLVDFRNLLLGLKDNQDVLKGVSQGLTAAAESATKFLRNLGSIVDFIVKHRTTFGLVGGALVGGRLAGRPGALIGAAVGAQSGGSLGSIIDILTPLLILGVTKRIGGGLRNAFSSETAARGGVEAAALGATVAGVATASRTLGDVVRGIAQSGINFGGTIVELAKTVILAVSAIRAAGVANIAKTGVGAIASLGVRGAAAAGVAAILDLPLAAIAAATVAAFVGYGFIKDIVNRSTEATRLRKEEQAFQGRVTTAKGIAEGLLNAPKEATATAPNFVELISTLRQTIDEANQKGEFKIAEELGKAETRIRTKFADIIPANTDQQLDDLLKNLQAQQKTRNEITKVVDSERKLIAAQIQTQIDLNQAATNEIRIRGQITDALREQRSISLDLLEAADKLRSAQTRGARETGLSTQEASLQAQLDIARARAEAADARGGSIKERILALREVRSIEEQLTDLAVKRQAEATKAAREEENTARQRARSAKEEVDSFVERLTRQQELNRQQVKDAELRHNQAVAEAASVKKNFEDSKRGLLEIERARKKALQESLTTEAIQSKFAIQIPTAPTPEGATTTSTFRRKIVERQPPPTPQPTPNAGISNLREEANRISVELSNLAEADLKKKFGPEIRAAQQAFNEAKRNVETTRSRILSLAADTTAAEAQGQAEILNLLNQLDKADAERINKQTDLTKAQQNLNIEVAKEKAAREAVQATVTRYISDLDKLGKVDEAAKRERIIEDTKAQLALDQARLDKQQEINRANQDYLEAVNRNTDALREQLNLQDQLLQAEQNLIDARTIGRRETEAGVRESFLQARLDIAKAQDEALNARGGSIAERAQSLEKIQAIERQILQVSIDRQRIAVDTAESQRQAADRNLAQAEREVETFDKRKKAQEEINRLILQGVRIQQSAAGAEGRAASEALRLQREGLADLQRQRAEVAAIPIAAHISPEERRRLDAEGRVFDEAIREQNIKILDAEARVAAAQARFESLGIAIKTADLENQTRTLDTENQLTRAVIDRTNKESELEQAKQRVRLETEKLADAEDGVVAALIRANTEANNLKGITIDIGASLKRGLVDIFTGTQKPLDALNSAAKDIATRFFEEILDKKVPFDLKLRLNFQEDIPEVAGEGGKKAGTNFFQNFFNKLFGGGGTRESVLGTGGGADVGAAILRQGQAPNATVAQRAAAARVQNTAAQGSSPVTDVFGNIQGFQNLASGAGQSTAAATGEVTSAAAEAPAAAAGAGAASAIPYIGLAVIALQTIASGLKAASAEQKRFGATDASVRRAVFQQLPILNIFGDLIGKNATESILGGKIFGSRVIGDLLANFLVPGIGLFKAPSRSVQVRQALRDLLQKAGVPEQQVVKTGGSKGVRAAAIGSVPSEADYQRFLALGFTKEQLGGSLPKKAAEDIKELGGVAKLSADELRLLGLAAPETTKATREMVANSQKTTTAVSDATRKISGLQTDIVSGLEKVDPKLLEKITAIDPNAFKDIATDFASAGADAAKRIPDIVAKALEKLPLDKIDLGKITGVIEDKAKDAIEAASKALSVVKDIFGGIGSTLKDFANPQNLEKFLKKGPLKAFGIGGPLSDFGVGPFSIFGPSSAALNVAQKSFGIGIFGGGDKANRNALDVLLGLQRAPNRPGVNELRFGAGLGLFSLIFKDTRQALEATNAFVNNAKLLGISADEARRQLLKLAETSNVTLGGAIDELNKRFLQGDITLQQYKSEVAGVEDLFNKAVPAINLYAATLASIDPVSNIIDTDVLGRRLEELNKVIGEGIPNALKDAIKNQDILGASRSLAETFYGAFVDRLSERILQDTVIGKFLSDAVIKAGEAAEALARGDTAKFNQLAAESRRLFQIGQNDVVKVLQAISPSAIAFGSSVGVFPGGAGLINQTGQGLPTFATDGVVRVPGPPGTPVIGVVHGDERVRSGESEDSIANALDNQADALRELAVSIRNNQGQPVNLRLIADVNGLAQVIPTKVEKDTDYRGANPNVGVR